MTLRGSTFEEYFKNLFFLLPSVHIQENLEDELVKEALEKVSQIDNSIILENVHYNCIRNLRQKTLGMYMCIQTAF